MAEEYRVEVELEDPEHGYSTEERIRALDLDDDVRERLGSTVMVTRDESSIFLYATSEAQARAAERVARELVAADELTADIPDNNRCCERADPDAASGCGRRSAGTAGRCARRRAVPCGSSPARRRRS